MIFNPIDSYYKSQIGAVKENTLITFRLRCFCDTTDFVIYDENGYFNRVKMQRENDCFVCSISLEKGLYFYYFDLNNGSFVSSNEQNLGVISESVNSFQLSVYSKDYQTPSFIKGGIIYQIFPDRFCRKERDKRIGKGKILHESWNEEPIFLPNEQGEVLNNDFFGGDIQGVISKLDYLKKLNVSVIYLNPIFEAYSNHRYDTGNYLKIDSLLGAEEDFKELIAKAQEKGIKIILDGVFNHTGSDSLYFNKNNSYEGVGAYQSKDSPYYKWYNFIEYPNTYASWWGIKTLPAVNKENGEFLSFITGKDGVLERYTKMGIGGWRLDVVDELPEEFSMAIRRAVKSVNKDAIIIGEVWEDASNKIAYGKRRKYFLGEELDSVMNYPLKNAILNYCDHGDCYELISVIRTQIDHYPKMVLDSLMNILSTHDTYRLLSALSGIDVSNMTKQQMQGVFIEKDDLERAIFKLKVAVLLQYTLFGAPSVYYGDEIGMEGFSDPLNRRTFAWEHINTEILDFYVKMGEIRQNSAFVDGDFEELYAKKGILIFKRKAEKSQVLVAVSLGDEEIFINVNGDVQNLLDGKIYGGKIKLQKNSFYIFANRV